MPIYCCYEYFFVTTYTYLKRYVEWFNNRCELNNNSNDSLNQVSLVIDSQHLWRSKRHNRRISIASVVLPSCFLACSHVMLKALILKQLRNKHLGLEKK